MNTWQDDQLQALQSIESEQQFFQAVVSLSRELGFDHCTYGLRIPFPITAPKSLIFTTYSTAWQEQYQSKSYLEIDPTIRHAISSLAPLIWTDELFSSTPELWEEARSYELHHGRMQSIRDSNGAVGMLSLARSNEPITEKELKVKQFKLAWLTQTAHLGMSRLLISKHLPEADVKLTNREITVLRWTADGKTAGEISSILNISERTVNFHINNVIAKLNVSNKTAATVKAALLGLL